MYKTEICILQITIMFRISQAHMVQNFLGPAFGADQWLKWGSVGWSQTPLLQDETTLLQDETSPASSPDPSASNADPSASFISPPLLAVQNGFGSLECFIIIKCTKFGYGSWFSQKLLKLLPPGTLQTADSTSMNKDCAAIDAVGSMSPL